MASLLSRLSLVAALSTACGGGGDDGMPDGGLDGMGPYDSCLPDCTGSRSYDVLGYVLSGHFDWDARQLVASEEITLFRTAPDVVVVELDSAVQISSVHAGEIMLPFVADTSAGRVRIDLGPLHPGAAPMTFTIDYVAPTSDSLLASGPRDDDPVTARMVFTDSEPNRGHRWLVGNHYPTDRATFAVDLTVVAGEDVIANGQRTLDENVSGGRRVRYEMADPIPTYLMAFAAGQIVHTDRTTGRVPLSVWHRQGLVVDAEANLDVISEAMATFEARLGLYPFDSYSVVLVPQYGGGMENATITFNNELSGQGVPSVSLHAHELGHHWFGDWVTMQSYDDVWVKEGMATVLAAEAQRARRDLQDKGRLMGTDFSFAPDDAIVDPTLTGLAKYTSGPYQRAAWVMTQIRTLVGEDAFWAGCRKALDDHVLGTIDGESFVRSFAPALDEPTIARILASLPKNAVPAITIGATPVAEGTNLSLILGDPENMLIAPIDVTVVDAAGTPVSHRLQPGVPLVVLVPTGGYIAPDEADVHPYWTSSFDVVLADFNSSIRPLMAPPAGAALLTYGARSASHQERTAVLGALPTMTSGSFGAYYDALDSFVAKRETVWDACFFLSTLAAGAEADGWRSTLAPIVTTPASLAYTTRYGRCGTAMATSALGAELASIASTATPAAHQRLEYLIAFDYGASTNLATIGGVATDAASLRLRDQALSRLASQTSGTSYSAIPDPEKDAWRAFFRARLADVTSATRFRLVWRGIFGLGDVSALPTVAPLLHSVTLTATTQRDTICNAHTMTGGDANWVAFQNALQPWTTLSTAAQGVLANPATCP